jgi:hypothetical protein
MTTTTVIEYEHTHKEMWKQMLEQVPNYFQPIMLKKQFEWFSKQMDRHKEEVGKRFDPFRDITNPVDYSDIRTWIVKPHHVTTSNYVGRIVTIEIVKINIIVKINYYGGTSLGDYL